MVVPVAFLSSGNLPMCLVSLFFSTLDNTKLGEVSNAPHCLHLNLNLGGYSPSFSFSLRCSSEE